MDSKTIANQLAAYDKNKKSSADILNEAMNQQGIPEIRTRVANLRTTLNNTENALNAVDPSVTGRTSRSLVTEAQRSAIVNKEREPLATQYGDQSRSLTTESANLTDQQAAAKALAEGRINDFTTGRQALTSQYELALNRELEQRRRLEADRAFKLQQQAAEDDRRARAAAASSGYSLGGGGDYSSAPQAAKPLGKTTKVQEEAYNDVASRVKANQSNDALMSDYLATASSAKRGNQKDLLKLQVYRKLRPDLFRATYSWEKTGGKYGTISGATY